MAKRSCEAKRKLRSGRDTSFPYEPTIPTIPTDEHYTAIETFSVVAARKFINEQEEFEEEVDRVQLLLQPEYLTSEQYNAKYIHGVGGDVQSILGYASHSRENRVILDQLHDSVLATQALFVRENRGVGCNLINRFGYIDIQLPAPEIGNHYWEPHQYPILSMRDAGRGMRDSGRGTEYDRDPIRSMRGGVNPCENGKSMESFLSIVDVSEAMIRKYNSHEKVVALLSMSGCVHGPWCTTCVSMVFSVYENVCDALGRIVEEFHYSDWDNINPPSYINPQMCLQYICMALAVYV